jgi:hypothetical protein
MHPNLSMQPKKGLQRYCATVSLRRNSYTVVNSMFFPSYWNMTMTQACSGLFFALYVAP